MPRTLLSICPKLFTVHYAVSTMYSVHYWLVLCCIGWSEYFRIFMPATTAGSDCQQQNVVIQNITSPHSSLTLQRHQSHTNIMRVISACLALLLGTVAARKEILKRQGDYYLRLHNQGGNLVLDEGI